MKTMKLLMAFVLALLIFGTASVLAADIDIRGATSPAGNPLTTVTVSLTAENQHATETRTILLQSTDLVHATNNQYKISAPQMSSISVTANSQKTVSFDVSLPSVLAGSYAGEITAQDATNTANKDTLAYTVTVNPVAALVVTGLSNNRIDFSGQEDVELKSTFEIKNTGSIAYTPVVMMSGDFVDSDDNEIVFGSISISAISPGSSKPAVLTAEVPRGMNLGEYSGELNITTGHATAAKSIPVNVNVEPETCSDGRVSDENPITSPNTGNIRIEIDNPDDGDEFKIGEELKISVDVENTYDDDLEVVVEAFLYNVDQDEEVASVESDVVDIKDGKSENVDLVLEVPSDSEMDDSDTYVLYVKAYEDGDEDINCNYDSIEMELTRNNHDVVADSFTTSPSSASCGSTVNFKVNTLNIGTKDEENVYVRLLEPSLGLDLESQKFDLEAYDEDDNEMIVSFNFKIPNNAEVKEYVPEAVVYFNNGKSSKTFDGNLKVTSCQSGTTPVTGSGATINLPKTSYTSTAGSTLTIPFTVRNNEASSKSYTLEVLANGWGEMVSQSVSLAAGQEITTYAYVNVGSNTNAGDYVAIINVREGSSVISSKSASVRVESSGTPSGSSTYSQTTTLGSIWRNLANSTTALIVGVLILVALVVLLIVLLAKR